MFQAWTHDSNGASEWVRVGEPQRSEASAWGLVHQIGCLLWPESAPSRRSFESRCKVSPIVPIQIG
jgi:hypothetical protein